MPVEKWSGSLPALPREISLTPEFRLLANCCSPQPLNDTADIRAHAEIDWAEFTRLTRRHQVETLVYRNLALCAPNLSTQAMKRRVGLLSARSLQLAAEVVRLNQVFSESRIDVIHLKGVLLSQRLFGEDTLRNVRDIDLLARPHQLEGARRLLSSLGYAEPLPHLTFTRKIAAPLFFSDHHLAFHHPARDISVDLHWRLFLWPPEAVAQLWDHRESVLWRNSSFSQLDRHSLLLLLCGHGAGHRWSHMKWLADVAVLLADLDIARSQELLTLTNQLKLRRALAQAALLCHWLLRVYLPRPLCRLIRDERACADLAMTALLTLLKSGSQVLGRARYWRYFLQLRTGIGWSAKLARS